MKLTYSITSNRELYQPQETVTVETELADICTLVPTVQRLERSLHDSLSLNYEAKQKKIKNLEDEEQQLQAKIRSLQSDLEDYEQNVSKIKTMLSKLGVDAQLIQELNDIPF